jgi:hypothetical protein
LVGQGWCYAQAPAHFKAIMAKNKIIYWLRFILHFPVWLFLRLFWCADGTHPKAYIKKRLWPDLTIRWHCHICGKTGIEKKIKFTGDD